VPTEPHLQPSKWPEGTREFFERAVTVSYSSLTKSGRPVTSPLTPYVSDHGTIDVSTGLTYPAKAERARRDPRVALLFSDPVGSGIAGPPVVAIQGVATIRDADLQGNTDRYVRLSSSKLPESTKGQPKFMLRRFVWYFARIWIEVTPLSMLVWPGGDLTSDPIKWEAPEGTEGPMSDPAPHGSSPPPWLEPPIGWMENAQYALAHLSHRDISFTDGSGAPLVLPAVDVKAHPQGFELQLPKGVELAGQTPACMTFHDHPEVFTGQENRTFTGEATPTPEGVAFKVEKAIADWSLPGNRVRMAAGFLSKGRKLAPRLAREAERRGQPIPKVRFPGEY
jgi:hypothetical protein